MSAEIRQKRRSYLLPFLNKVSIALIFDMELSFTSKLQWLLKFDKRHGLETYVTYVLAKEINC